MRKFIITLLLLAAILAGVAIYLVATTPTQTKRVKFPLDDDARAMIAVVPESAEAFALVPTAAALDAKMRANPVTRDAIASWKETQQLPRPWMLGGADLLAWRTGEGRTRYFIRLDPFRAFLVRAFIMINGDIGNTLLINAPAEQAIASGERDEIASLAAKLPAADALVVQRRSSRGAFPPIARPAVSSVRIEPNEIDITSAAATDEAGAPLVARFPRGAIVSGAFTFVPRIVSDANRLFGANVSTLFGNGGAVAIYDVQLGKLLPRPIGVFAFPDDAERQAAVDNIKRLNAFGVNVRGLSKDNTLLLSFDPSLDMYIKDTFDEIRLPSARWAARADPARLVPILDSLSDNLGLRIATPRLSRSVKDVDRWIGALRQAKTIDAIDTSDGQIEHLQVAIKSK